MMLTKIPLGYATNRGMGAIAVDRININGFGLAGDLATLSNLTLEGNHLNDLNHELLSTLNKKWKEWIEKTSKNQERVKQ